MNRKKLTGLQGEFVQIDKRPERDCLMFECPACDNGHMIMISWNPPSLFKSGAIWKKTGTTLEDVTISPSINCDVPWENSKGNMQESNCKFHGWVRNGQVEW